MNSIKNVAQLLNLMALRSGRNLIRIKESDVEQLVGAPLSNKYIEALSKELTNYNFLFIDPPSPDFIMYSVTALSRSARTKFNLTKEEVNNPNLVMLETEKLK